MENKYYTPNIEDIHVGYEFEYNGHYTHTKSDWENKVVTPEWYGMNYDSSWDPDPTITFYMGMLRSHPENFRVPYLTKEQIEAEGWELLAEYESGNRWLKFQKIPKIGNPIILHYSDKKWLLFSQESLIKDALSIQYSGECKSINEFKYICKLLNI